MKRDLNLSSWSDKVCQPAFRWTSLGFREKSCYKCHLKTSKLQEYSQISLEISRGSFVQKLSCLEHTPYVTNCLFVFWPAYVPRDMKYFRGSSKEERLGNTELGRQIRWQKDRHNPEMSSVYFAQRGHDYHFQLWPENTKLQTKPEECLKKNLASHGTQIS